MRRRHREVSTPFFFFFVLYSVKSFLLSCASVYRKLYSLFLFHVAVFKLHDQCPGELWVHFAHVCTSCNLFFLLSQRKLLAIYLHNDDSVLSNVFCSQMMCADSIVSYLSQNFITWAWDVTKEANKARYQNACCSAGCRQFCHFTGVSGIKCGPRGLIHKKMCSFQPYAIII